MTSTNWTDLSKEYCHNKGIAFRLFKKGTPEHNEILKMKEAKLNPPPEPPRPSTPPEQPKQKRGRPALKAIEPVVQEVEAPKDTPKTKQTKKTDSHICTICRGKITVEL